LPGRSNDSGHPEFKTKSGLRLLNVNTPGRSPAVFQVRPNLQQLLAGVSGKYKRTSRGGPGAADEIPMEMPAVESGIGGWQ